MSLRKEIVTPGRHQLVASKRDHVPDTRQMAVSPGERARAVLVPRSVDEVARRERRWAVWKPWIAVAVGAGLVAGAGYLDWKSSQGFDRFDHEFEANVDCLLRGCQRHEIRALVEQRDSATRQQYAALGLYVAGGAALAAGAALVYFNRERLVHHSEERRPSITPALAPGSAGVSIQVSF